MKRGAFALLGVWLTFGSVASGAASFELVVADGPGEGLNDPTPFTPVGGNFGTTLGTARRILLARMFAEVGCRLQSGVPINVSVQFDPMECSTSSAVLASAGPWQAVRNFPGSVRVNTFYPVALANALAGVDLAPQSPDVFMTINSSLGSPGCLPSSPWYLGFDSAGPSSSPDLFTTSMHELVHGLGFMTFSNASTGEKFFGADDVYIANLLALNGVPQNYSAMTDAGRAEANRSEPFLVWNGSNLLGTYGAAAPLYAPASFLPGSSVSHLSNSLFPEELMRPFYNGPQHELGRALSVLADEGWMVQAQCATPAPATPSWALAVLAGLLVAGAGAACRRLVAAGSAPLRTN